jgi:hypothetical protein
MSRSHLPQSLDEIARLELFGENENLVALPVWRGSDDYFLGRPVYVESTQIGSLSELIHRPRRVQFDDISGQRHGYLPRIVRTYLLSKKGRVERLEIDWNRNPDHGWVIREAGAVGPRWKNELVQTFNEGDSVSLAGKQKAGDFWRWEGRFDCTDGAIHDPSGWRDAESLAEAVRAYCDSLVLQVDYSGRDRARLTAFLDGIPSPTGSEVVDQWVERDDAIVLTPHSRP